MRHVIEIDSLRAEVGPQIDEMARAVEACVHCGFCLATCPTYLTMGEEMDSPRGRIVLMKGVLERQIELDDALTHIDPCLGCVACQTSCPSGVQYGELITPFRSWAEGRRGGFVRRLYRRARLVVMARPVFMRALSRVGLWLVPLKRWLPESLAAPLELLPDSLPKSVALPARAEAIDSKRARVLLLAGCAQQVLQPAINLATIDVLRYNGVEVLIPPEQGCCGALALHGGDMAYARKLGRRNLEIFGALCEGGLDGVDAILTNAAGCGSGLDDYPLLFKGEPEEDAARRLADKVMDVTTFLARLGLEVGYRLERPTRVVYQDACHLAHAQQERSAPRRLLAQVENLELVEAAEWEVCCGSAGLYNLDHPETAHQLGERKVRHLLMTGAEIVVVGNIGCSTQIKTHLRQQEGTTRVEHTMELLARCQILPGS